jgi:hypothetical protein
MAKRESTYTVTADNLKPWEKIETVEVIGNLELQSIMWQISIF